MKEVKIPEEVLVKTDDTENIKEEARLKSIDKDAGKERSRYKNSADAEKEFSAVIDDMNTETGQIDNLAGNKIAEGVPFRQVFAEEGKAKEALTNATNLVTTAKARTADILAPGSNVIPTGKEETYKSGHEILDAANKYFNVATHSISKIADEQNNSFVQSNQKNLQKGIDKLNNHTIMTKGHGVEEGTSSNTNYSQADKSAVSAKDLYSRQHFYSYKLTEKGRRILSNRGVLI